MPQPINRCFLGHYVLLTSDSAAGALGNKLISIRAIHGTRHASCDVEFKCRLEVTVVFRFGRGCASAGGVAY